MFGTQGRQASVGHSVELGVIKDDGAIIWPAGSWRSKSSESKSRTARLSLEATEHYTAANNSVARLWGGQQPIDNCLRRQRFRFSAQVLSRIRGFVGQGRQLTRASPAMVM